MASNRSVHARNVHKKLIYLLCAQMMFPMGAYAIGGSTIVISLSMQLVWMQQAFNFAILIFSNYGFAASMCLIVCNEPYLRHTKKLFSCEFIPASCSGKAEFCLKRKISYQNQSMSFFSRCEEQKEEFCYCPCHRQECCFDIVRKCFYNKSIQIQFILNIIPCQEVRNL
ncbi:hypothetical protein B9Z55_025493 [Caenorhabditis nigoni]|uniref:Uncharacterized protein n=1 Tax=Caenorhabditis nigoni TaxID=1611254 RepID=A0A2G5SZE4_9PELO|nr:hypothetical protein B9Z55_025493 [Caenorhabditis nigoni]